MNVVTSPPSLSLGWRLAAYVKPYWFILAIGIISTMLFSGLDAFAIYLAQPFVNKGFVDQDMEFLRWFPWIVGACFIFRGIVNFTSTYCVTWVARTVITNLRQEIFCHMQKLPARYFDQHTTGQLLSRLLYDVEQVAQVSTDALTNVVQAVSLVVGLIIVMVSISWQLSAVFLLVSPLIYLVIKSSNNYIRRYSLRVQATMGNLTEVAEEFIEGYQDVRMLGAEQHARNNFMSASEACRRGDIKATMVRAIGSTAIQMLAAMMISALLFFMLQPDNLFHLTPGGFSAILIAMLAILKPLKIIANSNSVIQRGLAGAQSVFAFYDQAVEVDAGRQTLGRARGEITIRNLQFRYDQEWVLRDINLHIRSGEIIALVGRSGSGKSTLVKLLTRLYNFTDGEIMLDGHDIRKLSLVELRRQFAYVGQRVTLFNGTIRENIVYGTTRKFTDDDIFAAAKQAHAHEFIMTLPEKYETPIGENGLRLSGGQRQRLAIARAIIKDAPILILDEATSALDSESERYIQDALQTVMQARTTIVIAHRLSTIERADRIIVLQHGRIVEEGQHQALLSDQGVYAKLHALQYSEVTPA